MTSTGTQITAPIAVPSRYLRGFIRVAPATIGASVRTHGIQRASTTDHQPCRSRNSPARSSRSWVMIRAPRLPNSLVEAFREM